MRAVNFETTVLVQDLVIQWLQPYPCKAKSQGVFFFFCNHCTSTFHRSETNVIAERAARSVKRNIRGISTIR